MIKEKEDKGWVKLHRNIQDHWLWNSEQEPFDMRSAWSDLIMMMNFEDRKFKMGQELVFVERGQRITSERKLSELWNWSRTKVRNFLEILEKDGMIEVKKTSKRTVIKICNFDLYQSKGREEKTRQEPDEDQTKTAQEPDEDQAETTREPREDTNKNVKNAKNDENAKNGNNEKDSVVVGVIGPAGNFAEICQKYMEIFGSPLTPTFQQAVQGYLDKGLTEDLIVLAIEEAGFQNCRSFSYLRGILNNWYNMDIKTVNQAKNYMAEYEEKKKSNNKGKGGKRYDNQKSSTADKGEEDFFKQVFG